MIAVKWSELEVVQLLMTKREKIKFQPEKEDDETTLVVAQKNYEDHIENSKEKERHKMYQDGGRWEGNRQRGLAINCQKIIKLLKPEYEITRALSPMRD